MRNTKKSLVASGISVIVVIAMLLGTTFAWFTDSVVNQGNKIQAGTLDIELWKDGVNISDSNTPVFDYNLWEPGYSTGLTQFKVVNAGSLYLKYTLAFSNVLSSGTKDITEVLNVYSVQDGATSLEGATKLGTVKELAESGSIGVADAVLAPKSTNTYNLVIQMDPNAGNEYQNAQVSFDIALIAKQADVETDGFGNSDYDSNAQYPFTVNGQVMFLNKGDNGLWQNAQNPDDQTNYVVDEESLDALRDLVNVKNSAVAKSDIALAADITLTKNWTPIGTGDQNSSRFQGTFDGGNHQIINLAAVNRLSYGNAFFGDLVSGAVIKNLTFVGADVKYSASGAASGNVYGIVAGYAYGNVTFENVHVKNSQVTGYGKVGALLGMAADKSGTTTLINCSVEDTTIKSVYNSGAFIGLAQNEVEITNCTSNNVTWTRGDSDSKYVMLDSSVTYESEKIAVQGWYWKYVYGGLTYHYAAWGDYYTDYDYGNVDPSLPLEGLGPNDVLADGLCHNK